MEKVNYFPWEESFTKKLLPEELIVLRDEHVDTIVGLVCDENKHLEPSWVIKELAMHGNYQKAALVTEKLIAVSQFFFDHIYSHCDPSLLFMLRSSNLMNLPRTPEQAREFFNLQK